ncbi:hypothetical protein DFH09DRAFT_1095509 [Mycena vulgaris]|nr:hypothetical protein DFH09DRAFT_1095509 [Mycena vulgaris]
MWADDEDLSPIWLEIAPEPDEVLLTEADLYQEAEDLYVSPARKKRKQRNLKTTVLKHPNLTSQPPKKTGTLLALHPTLVSDQVSAATDGDADGDAPEDTFLDDEFSVSTSDAYSDFVERVKLGAVGFYQISRSLFGRWYHVEEVDDSQNIFMCTCGIDGKCVHERFMTEEGTEVFAGEINDYPEAAKVHLRKIAGVEGLADNGEEAELDFILFCARVCCSSSCLSPTDPSTGVDRCVVYTLTKAVRAEIEVQMCHSCSSGQRRYIGRDLELFDYNNRTLFTHSLFDEYTSAFTSSETPFVAWVCCPLFVTLQQLLLLHQATIHNPTLRKADRPLVEGPASDEGGVDENVAEGPEGLDAEAEVEQAKQKGRR